MMYKAMQQPMAPNWIMRARLPRIVLIGLKIWLQLQAIRAEGGALSVGPQEEFRTDCEVEGADLSIGAAPICDGETNKE
jgi:hypothetical protein